jgi:hypothetical protein
MKYDWSDIQSFKMKGAKINKPFIHISKRKTFKLSSGFMHYAQKQAAGMTHVVLNYSQANNAIIFQFTTDNGNPNALKISGKKSYLISAMPFFNYHNIDAQKYAGRHEAILENIPFIGEAWVVFLDKH